MYKYIDNYGICWYNTHGRKSTSPNGLEPGGSKLKKLDLTHVVMYVVFLIVGWAAAVMIWNQYRIQVILLALAAVTFYVLRYISKHNKKKKDDEDGSGQGGVHVHFH